MSPSRVILALSLLALAAAVPAAAQDTAFRSRLDPLLTVTLGAPSGPGLVATALAEAQIAAQEAARATGSTDLAVMQAHARGVLHAVDPALAPRGPGLGYGVRRAVVEIAAQVEALAVEDPQADVVRFAPRALAAAANVLAWCDALAAAAARIGAAGSVREAVASAEEMARLARRLTAGIVPDGERHLAATPGEAGLLGLRLSLRVLAVSRQAADAARMEATR